MSIFGPKDDKGGGGGPNPQFRVTIFTLASAYIMYLGFSMIRTAMNEDPGMPLWAAWLIGLGFIAAGGFFLFQYIREYMRLRNAENENAAEEGASEETENLIEENASEEAEALIEENVSEENEDEDDQELPDEDSADDAEM